MANNKDNTSPRPLVWETRNGGLYAVDPTGAWDGDEFGNEWRCGFAVHRGPDGAITLYEDDGDGNGDAIASVHTINDAKALAAEIVRAGPYGRAAALKKAGAL